jgi:hypothetical protein
MLFSTHLGLIKLNDLSFKSETELKNHAHREGYLFDESDIDEEEKATLYCRLLIFIAATHEDGRELTAEEVQSLNKKELDDFATLYYYASGEDAIIEDDNYIEALYHNVLEAEHSFKQKMRSLHSPFSDETTMASLSSIEQHHSVLREIWENSWQKDDKTSISQRIKNLLTIKGQIENRDTAPSLSEINGTLNEIVSMLNERSMSEFKRDIETKRTVNRNLILVIISLSVGLVNLMLNILRFFE